MEIEESDPFHPVAMYNLSEKGMEIQKIEQLYKILRPLLYVHRAEAAQQLRAYWGRSVHFSTQIANSKKMFQLHLPNIYKDMIQILRNKIEMVHYKIYPVDYIIKLYVVLGWWRQ